MSLEIERKFLVKDLKKYIKLSKFYYDKISQGYLVNSPEKVIRVRFVESTLWGSCRGWITIKKPISHMTRKEEEFGIDSELALKLIKECSGIIQKKRYHIPIIKRNNINGGWEIDIFAGANKGLVVAELELADEKESFDYPEWLGEEVTRDTKYLNSNLAINPYCNWK